MMQQEQKKGSEERKRNYEGGKIGKKSRTHLTISLMHRGVCKGKRSKRANHHSARVIGSGIDLT